MNDLKDQVKLPRKRRESFKDRVAILFDELRLSIQFHRSSVLLAVYGSELIREKAERSLRESLFALGQNVCEMEINEELFDLPALFEQHSVSENIVFYLSGLQWGGGVDGQNAYRSLNLRRDYFVDHQLRVILWLTESEAANLPRLAPDFWSFRHRVVEFLEAPVRKRRQAYQGDLSWPNWESHHFTQDIDGEIGLRKQLLANLPAGPESNANRADLYLALAALSWAKGESMVSLAYLNRGKGNALQTKEPALIARFWMGMGFISHAEERQDEAIEAYKIALEQQPKNPVTWIYLSQVYRDKRWMTEAIEASRKAIKLNPIVADYWNFLGNLYRDQRRMEDAIRSYQRAIELDSDVSSIWCNLGYAYHMIARLPEAISAYQEAVRLSPQNGVAYVSLAACFRKSGSKTEMDNYLHLARSLIVQGNAYLEASVESVCGNVDNALAIIKLAMQQKQISQSQLQNDPNFDFLRSDSKFQALVGS